MPSGHKTRLFSFEGFIRMAADAILINLALLVALFARILFIVANGNPEAEISIRSMIWLYIQAYGNNSWLLTIISLIIFTASGFYTYGRFYRGRYKFVLIVQAVSLAYMVFGLLIYLSQGIFLSFLGNMLNFPRGALVAAWALTILFLVTARAWSMIWKRITHIEDQKLARY